MGNADILYKSLMFNFSYEHALTAASTALYTNEVAIGVPSKRLRSLRQVIVAVNVGPYAVVVSFVARPRVASPVALIEKTSPQSFCKAA